jgi:hypothetical protein
MSQLRPHAVAGGTIMLPRGSIDQTTWPDDTTKLPPMTGGGFSLDEQPLYSSFTRTKTFDPRPPAMQYQEARDEKRRARRAKHIINGWDHSPQNLGRIAEAAKAKREMIKIRMARVQRETMRMNASGKITKRVILRPKPPPEKRFTTRAPVGPPRMGRPPGTGFRLTPEPGEKPKKTVRISSNKNNSRTR